VAEFAAGRAEILGNDPAAARATAERIWDRTPTTEPAVQMANQLGMVFAKLNCKPRWRERLSELAIPTLVIHGRRDPFFPVGNGEALAREIPDARLLVLERQPPAIVPILGQETAHRLGGELIDRERVAFQPPAQVPQRDQRPDDHRWRVAAPDQPGAVPVHERPERPRLPARTRHDPHLPTEPRPRSRWTNRAPKLCRQPPRRRRPRRRFRVRTSAAVGTAITSGAACAGSSTARRPFRTEAGRRRGHREDPHRNQSTDLPCAHVAVFRHRGAPPPVTRTRSQSQAKQQPTGGGPALLPFVHCRSRRG
jgi:hypothetical protein